ncbi:MAG: ECF transporter S component [Atribacterota bacterium]
MQREKENRIRWITGTALLFALVLVIQMLGFPQLVTGPLVNMVLLLATIFQGIGSGVIIGFFTPWIAFSRGILPPPLAPMIPFIMVGNAVLVIIFGAFLTRRTFLWKIVGIIAGALVKYLLLSQAVTFLVKVPGPVAQAMQIPQLVTALLGGTLALGLEQVLRRTLVQR